MKRLLRVIVLFILTTLITRLLLKFWVLKAEVQRLRDQLAQMQASTDERIAQHKSEAERKYEELQLQ
ncbi:hypothetical protein Gotur_018844, partial [Gossypium turneri]